MQDVVGKSSPQKPLDDYEKSLRQEAEQRIASLRRGHLPGMVDWFDPSILMKVGFRTILSKTIGDYADQRPMQAAADHVASEADLAERHDYSNLYPGNPKAELQPDGSLRLKQPERTVALPNPSPYADKSLRLDADGALWVDFVADLGDGYEATYAIASLLAKSKLTVEDREKGAPPLELKAGEFLIFGGDLAYPDATIKAYNERCIEPYSDAFQLRENKEPKRKLFFISGNHDWYDGLGAFTNVFCAARDQFSQGKGKKIGGWQCEQRRSYFALGLPYHWWIWGIDLALSETIDDAQRDYFELMSAKTAPGDKIIITLHAPIWQQGGDCKHLIEVSEFARNRGAEVVAVLAGDLHFYSRYHTQSDKLDLQLIVSGGGGAFAHPTHQETLKQRVDWSIPKPTPLPHHAKSDYQAEKLSVTADVEPEKPASDRNHRRAFHDPIAHDFFAPAHFYPTRLTSRLLALKNFWMPLHNRRLALFLGVVYMLYAWVYQITVADPTEAIRRAQTVSIEKACHLEPAALEALAPKSDELIGQCVKTRTAELDKRLEAFRSGDASSDLERTKAEWQKFFDKRNEFTVAQNWAWLVDRGSKYLSAGFSIPRIMHAMLDNPVLFLMIAGLWAGLVKYVDITARWIKWPGKLILGTAHFAAHMLVLLTTNAIFDYPYQAMVNTSSPWQMVAGVSLYTFLMLMIGGFVGGAVFGIYSALTSFFGGMHMDAFSALGIRGYKNFLRMRFDKSGSLTIYAIGLDKVPGRKAWRVLDPVRDKADYEDNNPLIVPNRPLRPKIIDVVTGGPVGSAWKWNK